MPKALIINIGEKFNYLTYTGNYKWIREKKEKHIECICICGKIKYYPVKSIVKGLSKSCGCKKSELTAKALTTHGLSCSVKNNRKRHPLYGVWDSIKRRCLKEKNKYYKNYGGRGIKICDEWKNDFSKFYEWAINNGWVLGLQIDRENNNGNYEPGNCRCTNRTVQSRNTRRNIIISAFGETKTLPEWAEDKKCTISYDTLYNRIKRMGWPPEKAIITNGKR